MALRVNGTTLPDTGSCTFNGSTVKKIIYNGTTVWTKMTALQTTNIVVEVIGGSNTQTSEKSMSIIMHTPVQGSGAGVALNAPLRADVYLTINGSSSVVSLTIAENNWTTSVSKRIANNATIVFDRVIFYNKDGYELGNYAVGASTITGTITKTYSVTLLQAA